MRETKPPVCIIRPYRRGDEFTIREIMTEATMETVWDFFCAAVCSEILPQVALLLIAFAFIGLGVPLYTCLLGVPVAIACIYVVVWSAHYIKAMELHEDLNNIQNTYMKEPKCGFWVAEVLLGDNEADQLPSLINKAKKVEYEFVKEDNLEGKIDEEGKKRYIVGTVALTKSLHGGSRGWLRRMAVRKTYRRRGIAMRLLDEVIEYATECCLEEIELVTTECHHKARELYYKRGFEARQTYFKYYLNVQQPMYMFTLFLKPPKAELSEVLS